MLSEIQYDLMNESPNFVGKIHLLKMKVDYQLFS